MDAMMAGGSWLRVGGGWLLVAGPPRADARGSLAPGGGATELRQNLRKSPHGGFRGSLRVSEVTL